MIWSRLIALIFEGVNSLFNQLDPVALGSGFSNAITTATGYISSAYQLLPVITVAILGIVFFDVLFVETSILAWKIFNWILRRFPTQS